jgi:hypothetical protein
MFLLPLDRRLRLYHDLLKEGDVTLGGRRGCRNGCDISDGRLDSVDRSVEGGTVSA